MIARIRPACFPEDCEVVRAIFREYIRVPSVDLGFQDLEREFAELPGRYAAPRGCILLAEADGSLIGCVAMRPVDGDICEMKRLYVRPRAQGGGVGRTLAEAIVAAARQAGYHEMRLDVLAEFAAARDLYHKLGFAKGEPVAFNPLPGTSFLGMRL